jgi:hypothetical protein
LIVFSQFFDEAPSFDEANPEQWLARKCSEKASAMVKIFNSTIAMNAAITSQLPVCLYSAAGGKVNHQTNRTR